MNTLTLDQASVKYGDHITFTAHADVSDTGVLVTFTHANGISSSSVEYHPAGDYTKSVGCYAQNWPDSPARGVATMEQVTSKGKRLRTTALVTVEFEVSA